MNAYNPPVRIPSDNEDAAEAWASDDCCDLCCAFPVRTELDGDKLCQSCADKWCHAEGAAERDLLPLEHPVMREALSDWNAKYAGLSDDGLRALSKGQRQFGRSGL